MGKSVQVYLLLFSSTIVRACNRAYERERERERRERERRRGREEGEIVLIRRRFM